MGLRWDKADLRTWEERKAEEERRKAIEEMPERLAALQTALDDADALNVDQEYRLTLLELGIDVESLLN